MEIDKDLLDRVYEDIDLGLLDDVKDPDRWGNLLLVKNEIVYSVTVPQYVRELSENPEVKNKYLISSNQARENLRMLNEGLE